jgi:L-threonylcarbamoyladenylate synthase
MDGTTVVSNSKTLKINTDNPDSSVMEEAALVLRQGGLVVAPTETLYGILAKADSKEAARRLIEVKGRPVDKPSAVFISGVSEIEKLAKLTPKARKLCEIFLPGPLTLVLESKVNLGGLFTSNGKTGFRISSAWIVASLVKEVGILSATSANLSGQINPKSVPEIYEQLGEKIDLYLDGGILNNPPSTAVEVINDRVKILREGAISAKEIHAALS